MRIGFGGPLYYSYSKEPPQQYIGTVLGPQIILSTSIADSRPPLRCGHGWGLGPPAPSCIWRKTDIPLVDPELA